MGDKQLLSCKERPPIVASHAVKLERTQVAAMHQHTKWGKQGLCQFASLAQLVRSDPRIQLPVAFLW